MQDIPGKDSDPSEENFERAISVITIAIIGWVDQQIAENEQSQNEDATMKANLLLQGTDHLRQYGIAGARSTSAAVLTIASLWAQSKIQQGQASEDELKAQMSWVMKSPAVQNAIQETFKPLDDESKRDAENFARGTEATINSFVSCAFKKFNSKLSASTSTEHEHYVEDIANLRSFFDALDEGGLSYIAKVLEIVTPTVMISDAFNPSREKTVADYYEYTLEMMQDILHSEESA